MSCWQGIIDEAIEAGIGHLALHQPVVDAALAEQRLVIAAFDQLTLIQYENLVAVAHAREPMRHD